MPAAAPAAAPVATDDAATTAASASGSHELAVPFNGDAETLMRPEQENMSTSAVAVMRRAAAADRHAMSVSSDPVVQVCARANLSAAHIARLRREQLSVAQIVALGEARDEGATCSVSVESRGGLNSSIDRDPFIDLRECVRELERSRGLIDASLHARVDLRDLRTTRLI